MSAFKKLAMNIVSQILDEAGTSVEKRQEINDKCDDFVMDAIAFYLENHGMESVFSEWRSEQDKIWDEYPYKDVVNKPAK